MATDSVTAGVDVEVALSYTDLKFLVGIGSMHGATGAFCTPSCVSCEAVS